MTEKQEFRDILRIGDKEVKGSLTIQHAITHVRGASFMLANAVIKSLKIDGSRKAGEFSQNDIEKIEECLKSPNKYNIPSWLFNRRKDRESGEDSHLISVDLDLTQQFDVRNMKKIKIYKGWRHAKGLAVRGQRTSTTHRRGGSTLGVTTKKKSGKK